MERRKFLIGAGSAAIGSSALIGSGAFTSVSANRTASVNVSGDSAALLSLDASKGVNSDYARQTSNGEVTVEIDGSNTYEDANGVNPDATTIALETFQVKNQGTQPVAVHVPPESVTPASVGAADGDYSGFYIDPQFSNRPNGTFDDTYKGTVSGTVVYYLSGGEDNFVDAAERAFDDSGGVGNYVLEAGQSFDFGFHIDSEDSSFNKDIDFTIKADTEPVPGRFGGS